ncbi:MAG: helix-turn-helix domain-containing protein [Candidatus Rhabdochlamydia sp.]
MEEEFRQLGQALKAKRVEKNLTLKDVKNGISIGESVLASIEEGTLGERLAAVYVQGFIKQYATFLGIQEEAIKKSYPHIFQQLSKKHDFSYGIGTLEMRVIPHKGEGKFKSLFIKILGIGAFLLLTGYIIWFFELV